MNIPTCIVENTEMEGIGPCKHISRRPDECRPRPNSDTKSSAGSHMNGGLHTHTHNGLGLDVTVKGCRKTSPPDICAPNENYYSQSSFQAGTYSLNSSNRPRDFYIEEDDEPLVNLASDSEEIENSSTHCHAAQEEYSNRGARNQLIIASIICLVFMVGEFVGGYLANSLAIMTDAGHLLSDFASFMISLFALWLANMRPTTKMSFGYYRAEVLGAVLSILIIWVLTGILVYLAVLRILDQSFEINANIMLITAGCGVFLNIVLGCVLHKTGHGHSHGIGGQSHGHGHSHGAHGDGLDQSHGNTDKSKNINVRAAFIHVIGDLIQSIGVFTAALIIKLVDEEKRSHIKLADPICTFVFSILVLITTITILRDAVYLLMEGVPKNIRLQNVHDDLLAIENVRTVHSLNVWALTVNRVALSVHLTVARENLTVEIYQTIQCRAACILRKKYSIQQITIQVEEYQDDIMSICSECKGPCSP